MQAPTYTQHLSGNASASPTGPSGRKTKGDDRRHRQKPQFTSAPSTIAPRASGGGGRPGKGRQQLGSVDGAFAGTLPALLPASTAGASTSNPPSSKYQSTPHLPFSPGVNSDDVVSGMAPRASGGFADADAEQRRRNDELACIAFRQFGLQIEEGLGPNHGLLVPLRGSARTESPMARRKRVLFAGCEMATGEHPEIDTQARRTLRLQEAVFHAHGLTMNPDGTVVPLETQIREQKQPLGEPSNRRVVDRLGEDPLCLGGYRWLGDTKWDSCGSIVKGGRICTEHGAYGQCQHASGCTSWARGVEDPHCSKHRGSRAGPPEEKVAISVAPRVIGCFAQLQIVDTESSTAAEIAAPPLAGAASARAGSASARATSEPQSAAPRLRFDPDTGEMMIDRSSLLSRPDSDSPPAHCSTAAAFAASSSGTTAPTETSRWTRRAAVRGAARVRVGWQKKIRRGSPGNGPQTTPRRTHITRRGLLQRCPPRPVACTTPR